MTGSDFLSQVNSADRLIKSGRPNRSKPKSKGSEIFAPFTVFW
jgi:hypothetical protein